MSAAFCPCLFPLLLILERLFISYFYRIKHNYLKSYFFALASNSTPRVKLSEASFNFIREKIRSQND